MAALPSASAASAADASLTPRSYATSIVKYMTAQLESIQKTSRTTGTAYRAMVALQQEIERDSVLNKQASKLIGTEIEPSAKAMGIRSVIEGPAQGIIPVLQKTLQALPATAPLLFRKIAPEAADSKA